MKRRLFLLTRCLALLPALLSAAFSLPARAADQQLLITPTARPADAAANALVRLFMDVCIPSAGEPAKVRAWAGAQHLELFTDPAALDAFVGPGGKGEAWQVPLPAGHFALSIRGTTQACAVFAEKADLALVAGDFEKIVDSVRRLGVAVDRQKDDSVAGPLGQARALVYHVAGAGGQGGLALTMLTAERPGGAFQASLQMLALPRNPAPPN